MKDNYAEISKKSHGFPRLRTISLRFSSAAQLISLPTTKACLEISSMYKHVENNKYLPEANRSKIGFHPLGLHF